MNSHKTKKLVTLHFAHLIRNFSRFGSLIRYIHVYNHTWGLFLYPSFYHLLSSKIGFPYSFDKVFIHTKIYLFTHDQHSYIICCTLPIISLVTETWFIRRMGFIPVETILRYQIHQKCSSLASDHSGARYPSACVRLLSMPPPHLCTI